MPHDPFCKLCNSAPETPTHLCKDCPYTCAVWTHVVRWLDLQQILPRNSTSTVYRWWKRCQKVFSKEQKPTFDGLMMYFWWNIWKERNRRFFQQESKEVVDVTYLIKEDFHLHQAATSLKISCPSPLVVLLWFVSVILLLLVFLGRNSFASFLVVLRHDKTSVVLWFEVVCISIIFLLLIKITANLLPFPSHKKNLSRCSCKHAFFFLVYEVSRNYADEWSCLCVYYLF